MSDPSVTQVTGIFSDFSMIRPDVLAHACERGTRVHRACELILMDIPPVLDDEIAGYVASFRYWLDKVVVDVLSKEQRIYHQLFGYHGKSDIICRLKGSGHWIVIDLKTPLAHQRSWEMQVAAYRELGRSKYLGEKIIDCGTVRLKKDGKPPIVNLVEQPDLAFNAFLGALTAYKYFKGGK